MKNLMWFIAGGAAIGVAFAVQSPYMAYAVWAFLLLAALAHLTSMAWLTGLECKRAVSAETLRQGETASVELTVTNKRGWPIPWIFVEDLHPGDFPREGANTRLAILMPGRTLRIQYTLRFTRRGYHRIGPAMLESGDLFGLQRRFRTGEQQDYVSVLPNVAYVETLTTTARRPQGPVRVTNRIYEDPTRIATLREYVPGDPMKSIHWKASAKHNQLYVKQNEPSNVLGGVLVLDFHENSYEPDGAEARRELGVTITASVTYLLHLSGEQVGFLTNARDAAQAAQYETPTQERLSKQEARDAVVGEIDPNLLSPLQVMPARSPTQAQNIIENLARVLPGHGLKIAQVLMSQHQRLPRDAALFPVVPQVTEELALVLAELKEAGFPVTVFLIRNPKQYMEAATLLAAHNIPVFHIEEERHLHELDLERLGR